MCPLQLQMLRSRRPSSLNISESNRGVSTTNTPPGREDTMDFPQIRGRVGHVFDDMQHMTAVKAGRADPDSAECRR